MLEPTYEEKKLTFRIHVVQSSTPLLNFSTFESCVTHESQFFFSSNGNERRVDALKVITHNYLEES